MINPPTCGFSSVCRLQATGRQQEKGSACPPAPLHSPRTPRCSGVILHQFLGEAQFYQTHKKAAEHSSPWAGVAGTELPPSFTHRRAASAHLPGECSVSAAATQGLPLSNPASSASKGNAIFLQAIPLQSHSRQIHHVTEEHISEIHTPGQCPRREREKKQPPNWTLFAKSSLITDLSKLFSQHHCFSAATITLNEL